MNQNNGNYQPKQKQSLDRTDKGAAHFRRGLHGRA